MPAIDGEILEQAGVAAATRFGPEQPFEVVALPQIEPTPSVNADYDGRGRFKPADEEHIRIGAHMKGKGATDMWPADEPIERIQMLCGHASKATTERYIKAR